MTYTSENLSLAALELFVHFKPELLPSDYISLRAKLPIGITVRHVELDELPTDWRRYPSPAELQRMGDEWIQSGETVAMTVPSAVTPPRTQLVAQSKAP